MALFGRNTARRRLRRAAEEALKIPTFSAPIDCTPWVTGGLWPAELSTLTSHTAPLVKHLKADLQRIVDSANEELKRIRRNGLSLPAQQSAEARVIEEARAFAVRRVESAVQNLRKKSASVPSNLQALDDLSFERSARAEGPTSYRGRVLPPRSEFALPERASSVVPPNGHSLPETDLVVTQEGSVPQVFGPISDPNLHGSQDTEVPEEITTLLRKIAPPEASFARQLAVDNFGSKASDAPSTVEDLAVDDAETRPRLRFVEPTDQQRRELMTLLNSVVHQEPELRWAIGVLEDGSKLLVTDLAHGWIPPWISLPAGIRLLWPSRRKSTVDSLLGQITWFESYSPGDKSPKESFEDICTTSSEPRLLPEVEDLGWALTEATHWRDGLPRIVNVLAKAIAARTGILDSELETLRAHLKQLRDELIAKYPDIAGGLLLNLMLLAATEALAVGEQVHANYHFAWFQKLSAPWAGGWEVGL